jgi:hypothetical protein
MALNEQVSTLSGVLIVPGPNVMHLADKILDLSGQFILMKTSEIRSSPEQANVFPS